MKKTVQELEQELAQARIKEVLDHGYPHDDVNFTMVVEFLYSEIKALRAEIEALKPKLKTHEEVANMTLDEKCEWLKANAHRLPNITIDLSDTSLVGAKESGSNE